MPHLTDAKIRKLTPPEKGRRLVFDDHRDAPTGFGVRVTAAGKRVFVLRYLTDDGKDRLLSIGQHDGNTWTLAAARKRAGELRREIDGGTDILEERRERRAALTVEDVAEKFLRTKRDRASYKDIAASLQTHVIPTLGERKITEVRRREVIALLEPLAEEKPRQAGVTLTYLRQLFSYAEDREIIEQSPIASLKAHKLGTGLTARQRGRVLSDAEIATLWAVTEPPEGIHRATLLALKLILVTGQRPGEVAGLRRSEIKGRMWTIPPERRGKTGDAHTVPLTDTALELIEAASGEQDAVFMARSAPLTSPALARAVKRCAEALGSENDPTWGVWRPHDLRRTMRTGLAAAGVSDTVAEAVIGHKRQGIAAVYDRHRYDQEKRAALEAWERRLLRIAEGEPAADNVVPLTREP
ncbi:MAG: tyrosine-type recombinase/integrase [Spiribacter salinus]|uniref:Tyrosine-type recombinase/integrase n=1 Tax=Spiribacter salinus TaxID=1335746 RepID=A0A540VQN1_9GAMM|nr:MAG: tyrosine-type recombinase/integrase [Spiribacter salinus]